MHGGGRVDTQFCVTCHNTGTTDANSGNVLTLSPMVHSIHSGRALTEEGVHYTIWGHSDLKNDYSEVGFPQPTRNCVKCHDGANPKTPQGDNWKPASRAPVGAVPPKVMTDLAFVPCQERDLRGQRRRRNGFDCSPPQARQQ